MDAIVLVYFNSIKVRLKHARQATIHSIMMHFNSIKVRLKHKYYVDDAEVWEFQFHKGTIKTRSLTEAVSSEVISIP